MEEKKETICALKTFSILKGGIALDIPLPFQIIYL